MRPSDASRSTTDYIQVRNTFIRRAGYATGSSVDWYEVTVAGFGYVDEQCSQYLGDLYQIRRGRDHIKNQLAAIASTSNAVLGLTGAGMVAISTTAAAFGLASQMTENASAALLYSMDPSDIDGLLRSQMQAYRNGVAAQRATYTSPNVAMEAVRGYLNLCLPVSIEAQIKAAIQNTVYVATPSNFGVPGLSRVQSGSPVVGIPSVQDLRENKKIVRVPPPSPNSLALNIMVGDLAVTRDQAILMQKKLCVGADGDLGKTGSRTRMAIRVVQTEKLGRPPSSLLDEATWIAANGLPLCDPTIHLNTFEHIALPDATAVTKMQERLKAYIAGDSAKFSAADKDLVKKPDFVGGDRLTADNRMAIKAMQRLYTPADVSGEYTSAISVIILP
ncbi:hypothetical protein NKH94_29285 [Mesorhizobium australicum]|uniref:hypothetical protein n=1 Tax=Mesorhizobium australicum TaxID=536018 RepID=UPI00333D0928